MKKSTTKTAKDLERRRELDMQVWDRMAIGCAHFEILEHLGRDFDETEIEGSMVRVAREIKKRRSKGLDDDAVNQLVLRWEWLFRQGADTGDLKLCQTVLLNIERLLGDDAPVAEGKGKDDKKLPKEYEPTDAELKSDMESHGLGEPDDVSEVLTQEEAEKQVAHSTGQESESAGSRDAAVSAALS